MATSESSRQKLLNTAAIVVIALLAVNVFLLINKYKQTQVVEEKTVQLNEADQLRSELQQQYHRALANLESLRGDNEELNEIIDQQKTELNKRRNAIEKIIGSGGELSLARTELGKLKVSIEEYIAQLQKLRNEYDALSAERDSLSLDNLSLLEELDSTQLLNEALNLEKADLSVENQQLALQKAQLAETVNLASVIKVKNVNVTPLKTRSTGKTVKKTFAKNVEQLRVCFQTVQNDLAQSGMEYFLIRIINPIGETMAFDDQGSGVFISKKTGEEIRFTALKEISYQGAESDCCMIWDPTIWSFPEGKYVVEIYNKGHLAGTGNFELK